MIELIVKDHMQIQLPHITAETEVSTAIQLLQQHNLIGAPVLDQQNHAIGYISEHELLKPMLEASYYCDAPLIVSDIMSHQTVSVAEHESLVDLANKMLTARPKNYPVLNKDKKVIGIINRTHVVNALASAYNSCHG